MQFSEEFYLGDTKVTEWVDGANGLRLRRLEAPRYTRSFGSVHVNDKPISYRATVEQPTYLREPLHLDSLAEARQVRDALNHLIDFWEDKPA